MYKHESNTYVGDGYHFNVLVSFNHKTPLITLYLKLILDMKIKF